MIKPLRVMRGLSSNAIRVPSGSQMPASVGTHSPSVISSVNGTRIISNNSARTALYLPAWVVNILI